MKVAIIGYSGAGKSTLAQAIAAHIEAPVLHLDSVGWSSGWVLRNREEASNRVEIFLDSNEKWVIDGNWKHFHQRRKFNEADMIVFMNFPRYRCLPRVLKRAVRYRGRSRQDMARGCQEKFDLEFAWWILVKGRSRETVHQYNQVAQEYSGKFHELHTPREVGLFLEELKRGTP